MKFEKNNLSESFLIELYNSLLLPRLIEEKMLNLLRQGKISKWFSGIGQEAISVGCTKALMKDEFILPMHRNLGVFTGRGLELSKLFSQFQGKENGFSKGRERSFHFGSNVHNIFGMISHLGPQLGVADGIALWHKIKKEKKCTLVFTGDGGTSEGDFHEALNVAAVWDLPVIFLIENNGYGLSTPTSEQYRCKKLIDKGVGYGIEAIQIEGNNVLEVYNIITKYAKEIRKNPRPVLIEALTFRMRGHEEASGTKYIPKKYFEEWGKKDPILNYEKFLIEEKLIDNSFVKETKDEIKTLIDNEWEISVSEPDIIPDTEKETRDVYFPYKHVPANIGESKTKKRFVNAITEALAESMSKFPELIIMGQDVADYGGVFKVTEGLVERFGKERVRNTPLCESAIIGTALGYSVKGGKAVVEMQFADFISSGFTQIINNVAKIYYRWEQNADIVIRMPTGAGVGAGPFHSQSNEAWFVHTPGLKVVYPSTPFDAKGLLNSAIADPNPIMYFEHKALYRSVSGEVPDDYYTIEIGKANLVNEGDEVLIITYGMGVHWAIEIVKELNISADILDLRSLMPWDKEAVEKSVKKTGKVIILHEDCLTGGIGGEISAWISENCFEFLDAPIMRSASLDTPVPFSTNLEKNFLPKERFKEQLKKLNRY
ncbi:MAG: dehydrogenase [Ignavibacteria bacterium GWB2_36_8]|nr:MAG: dehydrogenase [Ignavibacteria bacterium GWB2_36_8]